MNKTQLISSLSEETTFSKRDITRVFEAFVRTVVRELKKGNKVQLAGLGTFNVVFRKERWGINPVTKERIKLPKTNVPKFKPGKHFKDLIRSTITSVR
jgi:DNA-binding protein HU-beta